MNNLYRQQLTEHYRNPRNRGRINAPDFSSDKQIPSCGDNILIEGRVQDGTITHISFEGQGCVISQATASLLSESVRGITLDAVRALDAAWITKLIGITLGPVRLKCALLPLQALQEGITLYASSTP